MTILTLTKKNSIRFPKEVAQHFRGARHFQVRYGAAGIVLSPVQIQPAVDLKAIPDHKPTPTK